MISSSRVRKQGVVGRFAAEVRGGESWSRVEAGCRVPHLKPLYEALEGRVLGQPEALDQLTCSFSRTLAGLRDTRRPMLSALLLGPTGVGKTETARALAAGLFGRETALTRIDCEEYAHGHEVAKLLGSPPGYVGHNVEPLLSQANLEAAHRTAAQEGGVLADRLVPEGGHLSILLFDELEKADSSLWSALLGALEEGRITLGDNRTVDLTHSIILMTSNLGGRELADREAHRAVGFRAAGRGVENEPDGEEIVLETARRRLPPEFLNRFDEVLVYRRLGEETLDRILDKFLAELHERLLSSAGVPMLLSLSDAARAALLEAGTDPGFGARPLRREVERQVVDPLSRLIADGTLRSGDVVSVDRDRDGLAFYRRERPATSVAV